MHTLWPSNFTSRHILDKKAYIHPEKTCTRMFTAALFIITPNYKPPKSSWGRMDSRMVIHTNSGMYTAMEWTSHSHTPESYKLHRCNVDRKQLNIKEHVLYNSIAIKYRNGKINLLSEMAGVILGSEQQEDRIWNVGVGKVVLIFVCLFVSCFACWLYMYLIGQNSSSCKMCIPLHVYVIPQ